MLGKQLRCRSAVSYIFLQAVAFEFLVFSSYWNILEKKMCQYKNKYTMFIVTAFIENKQIVLKFFYCFYILLSRLYVLCRIDAIPAFLYKRGIHVDS